MSDSSFSSSASTIILDEVPCKRQRIEDTHAESAKQVVTTLDFHEFLNPSLRVSRKAVYHHVLHSRVFFLWLFVVD